MIGRTNASAGGGGIAWNVRSVFSLPSTGSAKDICLVFTKEAAPQLSTYVKKYTITETNDTLTVSNPPQAAIDEYNAALAAWNALQPPSVSTLNKVYFMTNINESDGNIYEQNSINIFSVKDGTTLGTIEAKIIDENSVNINIKLRSSVVNINGFQAECEVYVWDITTSSWKNAAYLELPVAFVEKLDIIDFFSKNVDTSSLSIWNELNFEDSTTTYVNEGVHNVSEDLDIIEFFSNGVTTTGLSIWDELGIIDYGTITVNDTPQPF